MGTYIKATELNISAELEEYLTGSEVSGSPNVVVKEREIAIAESIVNGHIGAKYSLPIDAADVTPLIKTLVEDITIHNLYKKSESLEIPEKWVSAYETAMAMLKMIQEGSLLLGLPTSDEPEAKVATGIGQWVRG